ncbi:MAG TPA: STAS domain-containing protein [Acidimicrobiales bacterium]|jgi:anti-anti-sigma factor
MALEVRRAAPFTTEIRGSKSHALVILTGELDVSTAGQLYEELATINREGVIHVALDLTALEFIDSTGISAIIAEHKRTTSAGGELIILTPHRQARRVFEVSGLMDVLNILPPENPDGPRSGTGRFGYQHHGGEEMEHTNPSPETADEERTEAADVAHEADRAPTEEEERLADESKERYAGEAKSVAEHERSMTETGANDKGEGRIP